MEDDLPMISYRTTIVDSNETHNLTAAHVGAMLQHVLLNMELAQIAYSDELVMDQEIDPETDVLTLTFTWVKSKKVYATVVASKIVAGATVH